MTDSSARKSRPRLSVAMVVRDEEDVLAGSIESVRLIADEIVVLDTGSTDTTASVVQQMGANVIRDAWADDFSAARNRCLREVTGDWILWLDAGEEVDEQSAIELRHFLDNHADTDTAYMLWVETPASGQDISREQAARLRLVPNRPDIRFEGRVRETMQPSIDAAGLNVTAAIGRIHRHQREHDPARKIARARRNLKLAALEGADTGGQRAAGLHLVVGDAHATLGENEKAREAFSAAIEAAEHASTEMLEGYYGLLTTYDEPSTIERQLNTCLEALEVFPLDAQLLLAMGNCLQARRRPDLATRCFQAAVEHGRVDLGVWHLSELAEVAADYLSLSLLIQGEDDKAKQGLEEALGRSPESIRLARRMLELHVKHGRLGEALGMVERLSIDPRHREAFDDVVRGACRAVEKDWDGALGHLRGAYKGGCRDPLCLRWLSVALLASGQVDEARGVLAKWQEIEPANAEVQAYLATLAQQSSRKKPFSDLAGRQFRIDQSEAVTKTDLPQSAVKRREEG